MSPTMIVGRVILPGVGLLLAAILFWQAVRNVAAGGAPEMITAPGGMPGTPAPSPEVAPTASFGLITAEGRVVAYPGCEVTVGSEVLGTIIHLPVRPKSAVHKGDLLVELRGDAVRAELRKANVALVEAEARLRTEHERVRRELLVPGFAPRSSGERPDMTSALARRDSAKADVDRLEIELARYKIVAPIDGVVVARHADPGETISPATPLVTIVDLSRLRVEAEVDEFDIDRVALGAEATVAAEGARGRRWQGSVEEIGDVVVPRSTHPEDPGRPSDTRILPVWVSFRETNPLKLGQRVEIEIAGSTRDR
jgi:membrane fusion protein (multidrug efflux system)